jgi:hypothetical protein
MDNPRVTVISPTIQEFLGTKYTFHEGHFRKAEHAHGRQRIIRLHRVVWETYYGPIPTGYIIHHKDHNLAHNDIENLACMTRGQHSEEHDNLSKMWEVTRSENGREAQRQRGQDIAQRQRDHMVTIICQWCGNTKSVPFAYRQTTKWCSLKCQYHGKRRVHRHELSCLVCHQPFTAHTKRKTCSPICHVELRVRPLWK